MKRAGFTIIEVIIATALIVLLVGLAVPTYTSFIQAQDFTLTVQKLSGCLQQAQLSAQAPEASHRFIRYVEARIVKGGGSTISCTEYYYSDKQVYLPALLNSGTVNLDLINNGSEPAVSLYNIDPVSMKVNGFLFDPTNTTTLRVFFDNLVRGKAVAVISENAAGVGTVLSPTQSSVDYGKDVDFSLEYGAPNVRFGASYGLVKSIVMDRLGTFHIE